MMHRMTPLRFGLIGLGAHGARYAGHLAAGEVPGARLSIACRRDRERGAAQAREMGVAFTTDYRKVLDDPAIDAVIIVLPPDLHPPVACEALAAGKAVLIEKPLAPDASAARRIQEAAARGQRPAMVAQTLRFNMVVRALKERAEDLGELRVASLSQRFEPSTRAWLDQSPGGGILRNTGVHSFDLLRFLTGLEAEEAFCFDQRAVTRGTEDGFAAVLKLGGGGLALVENCRSTASRSGRIELIGERGQLCGDHLHGTLFEVHGMEARPLPVPAPVPTVRECLAAFSAAVRGETPVPIPLAEGVRAMEMVDACRESMEMKMPRRVAGHLPSDAAISPGS